MQRQRQHVDSTKTADDCEHVPEEELGEWSKTAKPRSKQDRLEVRLIDDMTNMVAMKTTGRYPIASDRGHKHLFVMFDKGTNHVCLEALKSRNSKEITWTSKSSHNCEDSKHDERGTITIAREPNK